MEDPVEIAAGQILAGKYRVERVLGEGGMGVVVAATHLELEERVAIKFLLPHIIKNKEAVARFLREGRAAAKIRSEHVARVTDVGRLDNGAPYMVMEYLEGSDLRTYLERRGPLPVEEVVTYVLQVCEALAEAHPIGIVHRDLKPANLFRIELSDGSPCIKVVDFGISKMGGDGQMTGTQAVMGSPFYMSPEQMAASKNVDARADIWSLGVIMFELLTVALPFVAETLPMLCVKVVTEAPRSVRTLRPDVPTGLDAVILRALARDLTVRFADVGQLARALLPYSPTSCHASIERICRVVGAPRLTGTTSALAVGIAPALPAAESPTELLRPAAAQTSTAWAEGGRLRRKPAALPIGLAIAGGLAIVGAVTYSLAFGLRSRAVATPIAGPSAVATLPSSPAPAVSPVEPTAPTQDAGPSVAPPPLPSSVPTTAKPTGSVGRPPPRRTGPGTNVGPKPVIPGDR